MPSFYLYLLRKNRRLATPSFFPQREKEEEQAWSNHRVNDVSPLIHFFTRHNLRGNFFVSFVRRNEDTQKKDPKQWELCFFPTCFRLFLMVPSWLYWCQLQLSWGKLRRKPATRWFGESFAPMPSCDNAICTSGKLPTFTTVSHGFVVARYSSPTFGSHDHHFHSEPNPLDFALEAVAEKAHFFFATPQKNSNVAQKKWVSQHALPFV